MVQSPFVVIALLDFVAREFALASPALLFPSNFDPFACLGLQRSALPPGSGRLKQAFRRAAIRWHPDHCRAASKKICETRMQQVNLAREVLSDSRKLQMWESWSRAAAADQRRQRGHDRQNQPPRRTPPRPPPPAPPPPPPPAPNRPAKPKTGDWREVSREKVQGISGAEIESITRERDLLGTPMVQVEVLERTCYAAQSQCQRKVLERRRRKREEAEESSTWGNGACSGASCYEVAGDHCHLSTSEEVMPTGPPPGGASFFRDVHTVDGCRERCNANDQCVAFQVKVHVACWLYRFQPRNPNSLSSSAGWACGLRRKS